MNSNYASIGKKIVAMIIDSVLANIFTSLIILFIILIEGFVWIWMIPVIALFVTLFYFALFEGLSNQATPGKQLMNLKVVTVTGAPVGVGTALLRAIVFEFLFLVDIIVALCTENNLAMHDSMTNTFVIDTAIAGNAYYQASAPAYQTSQQNNAYNSPSIVCLSGIYAGNCYSIGDGVVLGTDITVCQIVLPAGNSGISRLHCKITFDYRSRMFIIHDMGSTNGTFLENGQRIFQGTPCAVNTGTRIYLASRNTSFELRF